MCAIYCFESKNDRATNNNNDVDGDDDDTRFLVCFGATLVL